MAGVKGRSGGRNAKSLAQHHEDGTFRKERHGHLLADPAKLVRLDMPTYLADDEYQISKKELFNQFAEYLYNMGQSLPEDAHMLAILVDLYAVYLSAVRKVEADPAATMGRKLASSVMIETAREIRTLLAEFKLTPSTRISIEQKEKNEKLSGMAGLKNGPE
jgi:phage terminase small subunit